MNKKIIFSYILILISAFSYAQNTVIEDPISAIYKLLSSENIKLKDNLAIYALNFEVSILKKDKSTVVTNIAANDSLAFSLFPSYKKFSTIDFRPLMGSKNRIKLIIPILIYGSSPEKMMYKDEKGNPLISLNAAVNAAHALYRPFKYNNVRDSEESLGHLLLKSLKDKKPLAATWEAITMDPICIVIHNIK